MPPASGVLLLVEDNPDHAFLVQRGLREQLRADLDVLHLSTMASAIARLGIGDVRCVVLDLSLPDASGLEAVKAIRTAAPDVPVVVLTGMDSNDLGRQALRLGAQDFLVKGQHGPDAVSRSVVFALERAQRQVAEQQQAHLAAQLVNAQRLAHLGSWERDLPNGEMTWSEEMYAVTGLTHEDVEADGHVYSYLALVPTTARAEVRALFEGWNPDRPAMVLGHPLVRPDGSARWVQCRVSCEADRVLGTMQDITDQKVAEDALAHQALHDALTGLPNRALLLDRLERALVYRTASSVAVLFMDLDRFKWVNDSLSHSAGDELLVAVGERLSAVLRPSDTLARLGGDEFVLLCEQLANETQALDVVARVTGALERPFLLAGREVVVSASIGLAMASSGDPESLLRDADTAMYRAKEKGRARYEIFDEDMRQRASQRLELEHDLRTALQEGQIRAWYQPVVELRTGRVVGCEALARWQHPTRGLLMPADFIGHAEETGQIVGLGKAVLQQACTQVAHWNLLRPADEQLTVSVNVSGRQLADTELISTVSEALALSGLSHSQLCLEVTESVVMEDVKASGAVLEQLRDIGVRTAVDDFGTGYSSLAYLLSLPVDVLKVDRSFVAALDSSEGPAVAIVRAIAVLAHALGLGVLAEGVETPEHLARLSELGVQEGQGYLWGKAVPGAEAMWAVHHQVLPVARTPSDVLELRK